MTKKNKSKSLRNFEISMSRKLQRNGALPRATGAPLSLLIKEQHKFAAQEPFFPKLGVTIWPVTGQGVIKSTKWPAVSYSRQISQNRKILANLNYHISIKTTQAILKCLTDLKSSVWFTLDSEDQTMFCDTLNFFQLDCRSRFPKH